MNQVVDLDIVRPEKSEIIIDGKEYDLTIIPWSIGLRMYDLMPAITELEKTGNITSEDYHSVLEIILDCLKLTDESLTIDWIDRWMNYERFVNMLPFVTKAIFATSKKNAEEDGLTEST